jgi:Ca2+-binding EF-hand superfamily protein
LHIAKLQVAKRDLDAKTDEEMAKKRELLKNSGKRPAKNKLLEFRNEDIPDYEKAAKEKETPIEALVKKLEQNGYTVEQAFELFDVGNEGKEKLLSVKEITDGFRELEINALDTEIQALVKVIDADQSGFVTLKEWQAILKPKLEVEKQFRTMMADVNIDDPIELEEKALDLRYRTKRLERDL